VSGSVGGYAGRRRFGPQGVAGTRASPPAPDPPPGGGTAMSPHGVAGWVLTIAGALRLSQRKTLADLVEAAARVGRATLCAIARCLPDSTAAKHRIKRVWRFCDNDRVHPEEVMPRVVR